MRDLEKGGYGRGELTSLPTSWQMEQTLHSMHSQFSFLTLAANAGVNKRQLGCPAKEGRKREREGGKRRRKKKVEMNQREEDEEHERRRTNHWRHILSR